MRCHTSFFSLERNSLRFERLANLIFLHTFLGSVFLSTRSPYKIFINSIPKSGTNLLIKTLSQFPTIRDTQISLHSEMAGSLWRPAKPLRRSLWKLFPSAKSSYRVAKNINTGVGFKQKLEDSVMIGGFHNVFVPTKDLEDLLYHVKPSWFAVGHMPFSNRLEQILVKNNFKMILIIRDPRDIIVSGVNFFLNRKELSLHEYYRGLSWHEGLMANIQGISANANYPTQPDIKSLLLDYMPWLSKPYVYLTRYEDLVGPRGGGSSRKQTRQIKAIAKHLEMHLCEDELIKIKEKSYGGTHTFRRGVIGSWRQEFNLEHRIACKKLIGDFLIELGYEKDGSW